MTRARRPTKAGPSRPRGAASAKTGTARATASPKVRPGRPRAAASAKTGSVRPRPTAAGRPDAQERPSVTARGASRSRPLDLLPAADLARRLLDEASQAASAARRRDRDVASAAEIIAQALIAGGRLVYAGTDTAGRLAALDAVECVADFFLPPSRVVAILGGGPRALSQPVEGADHDVRDAETRLRGVALGPRDVLCVVSPDGLTPFAEAALAYGRRRRSRRILFTCASRVHADVDLLLTVPIGPEVVAGMTRLKAATVIRILLSTLSTTVMALVGKLYGDVMIDVAPHSDRLRAQAVRILVDLTGLDDKRADRLLTRAGGRTKTALVMHHRRVSRARAEALIVEHAGRLRPLIT